MAEDDASRQTQEFLDLFTRIKTDFLDWVIEEGEKLSVSSEEIMSMLVRHVISQDPEDAKPFIAFLPNIPEAMNYVSVGEAADLKGVHRQTIRDAIMTGRIKAYQSGRIWMIDRESLEAYQPVEARKGPRKKKAED